MKTKEIREKFIKFFQDKQHTFVPSASTIPIGDKTILFTIAGMTQFKKSLTGEEIRPYKRAVNAQKCIRVSDLDDVGKDGRHCTMFEMLGSWSFGDYYKKEAILWAYEFVKDVLQFDLKHFWATVHTTDDEALEIWKSIGVPENKIKKLGDKDNFWAMGPTGPCGPCSELYLDQGEAVGKCDDKTFDCKAGPGCECDRYLEFWNLVFMQYNRLDDGTL
ncbi:MAG: alanine--tRNA ligase, partial [Silvanigrellaceae bacterium]|nr:alanine--tRNA ligase [Silvanigrellaceae bacterium]